MIWGTFSLTHIISLIISPSIIIALYFILKNKSENTKWYTLLALSFSGIIAIVFNLVMWGSPIEYLPLHMCSINAILLPIAVLTKNKYIGNLLILWGLGALIALLLNFQVANYSIFSWTFVIYYFPHTFEFGVPILLFLFKFIKLDYKTIPVTLAVTLLIYTAIHFINIGINNYCVNNNILDYEGNLIQVNYMFSFSPDNPVLKLFYKIIPFRYFYMLLALPIILIYLVCIYSPQIIKRIKKRRKINA